VVAAASGGRQREPRPAEGRPGTLEDRARIRTEVAVELFREEFGRDPADAREIAGHHRQALSSPHERGRRLRPDLLPREERQHLWAIADQAGRGRDRAGPPEAVKDALAYLEDHACSPVKAPRASARSRPAGWSPPPSRTATPAPATPTCTPTSPSPTRSRPRARASGWPSTGGSVQGHRDRLRDLQHPPGASPARALGVRFEARPGTDPRKRPIREIVGVDPALNERWSSRRASIEAAASVLAKAFQATTAGRPRRSSRSSWRSRRPWRPARPSTNHARWPSSAPRGPVRPARCWGAPRRVEAMIASALSPARGPRAPRWTRRG
jgi:hypothetical protein